MAAKKRKRSGTPRRSAASSNATTGPSREVVRQEHKEEARRQRDAMIRRRHRQRVLRKGIRWAAVVAAVGLLTGFLVLRSAQKGKIVAEANRVADGAGCTRVVARPDLGNPHLASGEQHQYEQHPATSGPHDPGPLPPDLHVYDAPVAETRGVHNLEHGYVLLYVGQDGNQALAPDVLRALEDVANNESKVILAPYPQLDKGKALALVAWDELQQCPNTITAEQATKLARSFIARFRAGGKAPEPSAP